jgi:hypothetical protein
VTREGKGEKWLEKKKRKKEKCLKAILNENSPFRIFMGPTFISGDPTANVTSNLSIQYEYTVV